MQTKEMVTIEFRYRDRPVNNRSECRSKTITIGVFDTFDEAIVEGNFALEVMEKKFKLHKFPKGNEAKKYRFSKSGGCFGSANRLITDLAYLKTPFEFYAKITTLTYEPLQETIDSVLLSVNNYREYKNQQ